MRILITMTGSWGTGSGTVVEALTAGFARRSHAVCVLYPENLAEEGGAHLAEDGAAHDGTPAGTPRPAPEAEHVVWPFPVRDGGVELPHFPLMIPDPNPRAPEGAWTYAAMSPAQRDLFVRAFGERLRATVEAFRPDVIECQHVWLMADVVREMGLPYVAAAHHSDQMAFRQDPHTAPFARRAALGATRIFALLEPGRREIVELYGVDPDRVVVMGNGYDREAFFPATVDREALLAAHGLDVPPDAPLVTFAGKLSKTKGIDVLLEANGILRARMARPPHVVVFGTGRLETALDPARTYDRDGFHLLGHQPYGVVRDFHNAARLSVMPSRSEGFGLATLEAMGCALPVVCSRLGGLDTLTVGALAEPGDAAGLADAVQHLVEMDDAAHAALRARALAVARTFSWDEIVERRLALYAEAPPMPGAPRPTRADVRAVAAEAVRPLRARLLRPDTRPEELVYPGDDAPDALHVGAFGPGDSERLVGIASVFSQPPPERLRGEVPDAAFAPGAAFRLRGMATDPDARGLGLGHALLDACVDHVRASGARFLWCDARVGAVGFYRSMGLTAWGDEYDVPGAGRHSLMWRAV